MFRLAVLAQRRDWQNRNHGAAVCEAQRSAGPDVNVEAILMVLFLQSARKILRQALDERRAALGDRTEMVSAAGRV